MGGREVTLRRHTYDHRVATVPDGTRSGAPRVGS